MSVNDLVTVIVAAAAVAASIVGIVISNAVDKRATRSALTDLAVSINEKTVAYEQQAGKIEAAKDEAELARSKQEGVLFVRMKEIEMLAGQADFLVDRIKPGFFARRIPPLARRPRYPQSVAVTLAQALELVADPWWADRYWDIGVQTGDDHFRALTYKYWGMALCGRCEYRRARAVIDKGLSIVSSEAAAECIFRGEICAGMIDFDPDKAECWRTAALDEYGKVARSNELYDIAQDRLSRIDRALQAQAPRTSYCTFRSAGSGPEDQADLQLTGEAQSSSDWPCRRIARLPGRIVPS